VLPTPTIAKGMFNFYAADLSPEPNNIRVCLAFASDKLSLEKGGDHKTDGPNSTYLCTQPGLWREVLTRETKLPTEM